MRRFLPFIIILAVGLLTVGGGAMLYRGKKQAATATAANVPPGTKTEEQFLHTRGEQNAPVTIEEFADFQCPSCSIVANLLHQLEQDYKGKVRVVFRHFPLKMHPHALKAAVAAEAAGAQGRFWEMHDLLYKHQTAWSQAADVPVMFEGYASTVGLDLEKFKADLQTPAVNRRVAADTELGMSRMVKNTPTVFVNGRQIPPPFSAEAFRAAIEAALNPPKDS